MAEYDAMGDGEVAEIAFLVEDEHQGRGIGTILLESLVQRGAGRGIRRFHAAFLRQNERMPDVFARAGFEVRWDHGDAGPGRRRLRAGAHRSAGSMHTLTVTTSPRHGPSRDCSARAPIAVVGAGRREGSIGRAIVDNLLQGDFTGTVHPVNPHPATIAGQTTYRSVLDIPGPVDLAVIAVPAAEVLEVARQCAEKDARGLVVISGGFAELGGERRPGGARCCSAGERACASSGPNCVGVVNTDPDIRMNANVLSGRAGTRAHRLSRPSPVASVSSCSPARTTLGLGVSTFVSMGNKADVSTNDLLQYWADDPATDVVLLYLESFGNPRKFAHLRATTGPPEADRRASRAAVPPRRARHPLPHRGTR